MRIQEQTIKDYYDSLSLEQRKAAFVEMADFLQYNEALWYSEELHEIYWDADGKRLGGYAESE